MYFKYCNIISIFNLSNFKIKEILFKITKINNNIKIISL